MFSLQWPLGYSNAFRAMRAQTPVEARLTLAALYLLSLAPVMLAWKRWIADVMCGVIGLLFLIRCLRAHDWGWLKETPVKIGLALWLYTLLVVSPMATQPTPSLMVAASWWRFLLLFAAVAYWLSAYPREMKRVSYWFAFVLCLMMVDGGVQFITGESLSGQARYSNRLTGPFSHLVLGIFLSKFSFPVLGVLFHEAWQHRRKKGLWLCFLLLTAITVVIVTSNERTALMSYLAGMAVAALFLFLRLESARRLIAGFGLAQAAVVAALFATQPYMQQRADESLQQLESFSGSPYGQLWKASYEIWKAHPLAGVGLKNFRSACPKLQAQGVVDYCDLHSHNIYLQWLSEAGAVGLIGLLALLAALVRAISRYGRQTKEGHILIAFAFAALIPNFFPLNAAQSFFANWPAMVMWLSVAMAMAMAQRASHE